MTAPILLENEHGRIALDPDTLAIRLGGRDGALWTLSEGGPATTALVTESSSTRASWHTIDGVLHGEVALDGTGLLLTLRAQTPHRRTVLRQPMSAWGKGLIFPLAEGRYIPAGNVLWRDFLATHLSELNTTEDLSLPLWSVDRPDSVVSVILTEPFHNTLTFERHGDALTLGLEHTFSTLAPDRPLRLRIHRGAPGDILSGPRRYRQELIDTGRFEPLATKPQAQRLFGATHAYLWGNGLLGEEDVRDWPRLLARLGGNGALAVALRSRLDSEARRLVQKPPSRPDRYQQRVLIRAVNAALNALARASWQVAEPNWPAMTARYGALRRDVARTFGAALAPDPALWGDGLSLRTVARLRKAGLTRLWLGLGDGFEGGLWHPEAVRAAVDAGFLVAPYDSYETALPPGQDPDWSTAHLGTAAYRDAAIVKPDGTLRAGFQQKGHYTDPARIRPQLQARVTALHRAVGFNSWFLDAYAAGMVFDSHRAGATRSQAQMADEYQESAQWVARTLGVAVGSENGNATTARGIVLAHGMQTPVIGWGDRAFQKALGGWFPAEQPAVFFRPAVLPEPYRTVHADPRYRLPLYQAVFHDAVITTHHWLFDTLKLSNVRADTELLQLLYAVPPLFHLSADTLTERLPAIRRQQAFFQPLHARLATRALVGFRWRSTDRRVQETRFADGTRLIANTTPGPVTVDGTILPGRSVTARVPGLPPTVYEILAVS
jgi:hypothetical protein